MVRDYHIGIDTSLSKFAIVVFDKEGKARFAYEEEVGKELVIEDIVAALKAVQADA